MVWVDEPPALAAAAADDVERFSRYVEYCRRHRTEDSIRNMSSENARIVMRNLLQLATDLSMDVRLTTGVLDRKTYDPLEPDFGSVLNGGNKVKIIIVGAPDDSRSNRVYNLVSGHSHGHIRCLGAEPSSLLHFMLVGDVAYRVELNDRTKESYACFNDAGGLVTSHYREVFQQKWNEMIRGRNEPEGHLGSR